MSEQAPLSLSSSPNIPSDKGTTTQLESLEKQLAAAKEKHAAKSAKSTNPKSTSSDTVTAAPGKENAKPAAKKRGPGTAKSTGNVKKEEKDCVR